MIRFESGKWEGLDGMGEEILRELKPRAENAMNDGLVLFEGELKMKLTGRGSGRRYYVPDTTTGAPGRAQDMGRIHVASAPGDPPAVLHGHLRNSMGHTKPKWTGWTVSGEVGSGLGATDANEKAKGYAARLEFGGVHIQGRDQAFRVPGPEGPEWRMVKAGTVIKTEPRPYMEPTAQRMEPILTVRFEEV